tara:strand:- start:360 stop:764 length:405 start_codon:yes stop_codon:yes gene_type:complete
MKLTDLEIREDDFDLFVALNPKEKIEFLFDATEVGTEAACLKQVNKLADRITLSRMPVQTQDFEIGKFRLNVTTVMNEIHLNSNSLRAIQKFIAKLWNDGLILAKLDLKKSEFDLYRFYRAYKILGKGSPICPN